MVTKPHSSPLTDLVSRIRDLIAEGDVSEALDQLRNLALNGSRELSDEVILLCGRRARLIRDERKGIVTNDYARAERLSTEAAALGLLEELDRKLPRSARPVPAPVVPAEAFAGAQVIGFEKIIGINNLKQIAWVEQGLRMSRAVCRILTPEGLGSGFQIGRGTLMTNNHVIPSPEIARQTKVEFNYQLPFGGDDKPSGSVRYDLEPDTLFRFSPASALDYTVVAVKPAEHLDKPAVESWGQLHLNPNAEPVPGEHVVIVQHPNGGPKQIVLTANSVLQVKRPHLHYWTDTMPGSSGSPVFNDLWQVIAIHRAVGPSMKAPHGWQHSNEGVLMSAIKPHLGNDWPK